MPRFASWNVNGIRACHKNGFMPWINSFDADVIGLQEVRAMPDQIPDELACLEGYYKAWFPAEEKGYSGVGILSRVPPKSVVIGMDRKEFDVEGRVLTAEFKGVYFVSVYFPNSQDAGARIDYKVRFCQAIHEWVNSLHKKGKSVILTGDFNIAHQEIDLARPKENEGTAGFLPQEREWMTHFLNSGWTDSFRYLHPDARDAYSWWSMRMRARERNVGWRIDYHAVPSADRDRIKGAAIHADVKGSDHCPVSLDFEADLA
jgi:exodeoxyribonuclease-3